MFQKIYFLFLILITTTPAIVKCQDTLKNANNQFGIALSLNINATTFYNSDFINSLKQQKLPAALGNTTIGFHSDFYLSKLNPQTKIMAVVGVSVLNQKKTSNNITLNAIASSSDFNLDYIVWKHPRQYFYPGIGIGWMTYKYSFVDKGNSPTSYPQSLQNFTGERNIQSGNLAYLNLTANYDWATDKSNTFLLGIRVSYHLGLNHKDFQLSDGSDLTQSPRLNASALSVGIALTIQ